MTDPTGNERPVCPVDGCHWLLEDGECPDHADQAPGGPEYLVERDTVESEEMSLDAFGGDA